MALKSLFRCQMAALSKTLLHPSGKTNTLGNRGCRWVRINARSHGLWRGAGLIDAPIMPISPGRQYIAYAFRTVRGRLATSVPIRFARTSQLISVH